MTSISQKIPTFIGGISQQPDELFPQGSVKEAVNVVPDIKGTLSKRPGSSLISSLSDTSEGTWYNYFRDNSEQYFMRIRFDGQVDVWDAKDGTPRTVKYVETPVDYISDQSLTNNQASPNAEEVYDSCDSDAFIAATQALQTTINNLQTTNGDIELLQVQRDRLEAEIAGTFTEVVVQNYHVLVGAYEVNGVWKEFGKPEAEAGYTIKRKYQRQASIKIEGSPSIQVFELYGYTKSRDAAASELTTVNNDIAALEATVPALVTAYTTALAAYEVEAANCNIYGNPYSKAAKSVSGTLKAPDYFKHTENQDLQFTTINDYTFVTNRKVQPVIGGVEQPPAIFTSYISLLNIAYSRPYTLYVSSTDSESLTYTRATAISVTPVTLQDGDGNCPLNGSTGVRTDNVGSGNITYQLDVIGTPYFVGGNDYDCRYTTRLTLISASAGTNVGDTWTTTLNGRIYTLRVTAATSTTTTADQVIEAGAITTGSILSASQVLTNLKAALDSGLDDTFTTKIIGNGIYVESTRQFEIATPDKLLLSTFSNEVNDVSELPAACKDGYVVKVANSYLLEDDYYLKFKATIPETDGDGVWIETYKPGISREFAYETMPYQIRRLADSTFEVSPIKWSAREVGDEETNPVPSFVNDPTIGQTGSPITKIVFFRNRLGLLSGESIVMSRTNNYFDFFGATAQTISDADPIDAKVSSTYPAILYDAIETVQGLMLFSNNQQFILITDNTDVFSPATISIKSVGSYRYNEKVRPVHMGQTIGFLNNAGYRTRFFELVPSRDYDYQAVETSKPVDQLIPADVDLIAESKDDNMLALAVREADDRAVWVYRFFNEGEKRVQSAWFQWKLSGSLLYHCIMQDVYYAVCEVPTGNPGKPTAVILQKFNLKLDRQDLLVKAANSIDNYDYQIHMDNYKISTPTEMTFIDDGDTDPLGAPPTGIAKPYTRWRLPIGSHGPQQLVAYELRLDASSQSGYITSGRYTELAAAGMPNGVMVYANGQWNENNVVSGYNFNMKVMLPTLYVTKKEGDSYRADTSASLVLHRGIFNFEATGSCEIKVARKGRKDYVVSYESTIQDGYNADDPPFAADVSRTIPIYDRNTNTSITINSAHPTPTNLISLTWEGDFTNKYYKRV